MISILSVTSFFLLYSPIEALLEFQGRIRAEQYNILGPNRTGARDAKRARVRYSPMVLNPLPDHAL